MNAFSLHPILRLVSFLVLLFGLSQPSFALEANDIKGVWQSFDDKTNLKKGQVKFYYNEKTKSYVGRIIKVTPAPGYTPKEYCDNCPGVFKGKKVEGLMVIWHLKPVMGADGKFSGKFDDGYLLDPVSGKTYRVAVKISRSKKVLEVRGHLGMEWIGRTQKWLRVK